MLISLNINGKTYNNVNVPSTDMPLLWVLRDILGLTGTKYGCGIEVCGACTVIIDNQREHSCVFNVGSAIGKKITTIEGLSADGQSHPLQKAWIAEQVPQCGYCQAGQIMSAVALLQAKPRPSDAEIDARFAVAAARVALARATGVAASTRAISAPWRAAITATMAESAPRRVRAGGEIVIVVASSVPDVGSRELQPFVRLAQI